MRGEAVEECKYQLVPMYTGERGKFCVYIIRERDSKQIPNF